MKLTLYYAPIACSLVQLVTLHESGAEFEVKPISLKNKQQHNSDYLRINPKAKVPVRVGAAPSSHPDLRPASLLRRARQRGEHPQARSRGSDQELQDRGRHAGGEGMDVRPLDRGRRLPLLGVEAVRRIQDRNTAVPELRGPRGADDEARERAARARL